jgi:hypothetical protein
MAAIERIANWYRVTFWALAGSLAFGAALVVVYGTAQAAVAQVVAVGLLASLASVVFGVVLGFLFGIPRRIEGEDSGKPGYVVNTNLEQVSDWLTKALLGIGLVELGNLVTGFGNLSRTLGAAMGGGDVSVSAAGGIIVFFAPVGFLGGYVWARTTFMGALTDLDNIVRTPVADSIVDLAAQVRLKANRVGAVQEDLAASEDEFENREPPLDIPAPVVGQVPDLVTLWREIEDVLLRLTGPPGDEVKDLADVIAVLQRRGVLDETIVDALNKLADATKQLRGGAVLSEKDSATVRATGAETLAALARLRRVAPAAFEQHVLAQVRAVAGPAWQIDLDAAFEGTDGRRIRVDALVRYADRLVAVEVRAQVLGKRLRWDKLVDLLGRVPKTLPLLLVLPDHAAAVRSLAGAQHLDTLRVLEWDTEANQLRAVLRDLLGDAT